MSANAVKAGSHAAVPIRHRTAREINAGTGNRWALANSGDRGKRPRRDRTALQRVALPAPAGVKFRVPNDPTATPVSQPGSGWLPEKNALHSLRRLGRDRA